MIDFRDIILGFVWSGETPYQIGLRVMFLLRAAFDGRVDIHFDDARDANFIITIYESLLLPNNQWSQYADPAALGGACEIICGF